MKGKEEVRGQEEKRREISGRSQEGREREREEVRGTNPSPGERERQNGREGEGEGGGNELMSESFEDVMLECLMLSVFLRQRVRLICALEKTA